MTLYQTNQAIRLLRNLAKQGPLPMKTHDEITKVLINLLNDKQKLQK